MVHAHFGREKECFASQFWSLDATLAFEVMAAGSRGHAARGSPRRAGPTRLSWPRGHAASPHLSLRAARAALHKACSLLDVCALEVYARGVVGAPPAARARELHALALTWRSQCVRDGGSARLARPTEVPPIRAPQRASPSSRFHKSIAQTPGSSSARLLCASVPKCGPSQRLGFWLPSSHACRRSTMHASVVHDQTTRLQEWHAVSSRMQRCPHALVNPSRQDGSTQGCQDFLPRRRHVFSPELGATLEVPPRSALGTDLSRRRPPPRRPTTRYPLPAPPAPPAARAARAARSSPIPMPRPPPCIVIS